MSPRKLSPLVGSALSLFLGFSLPVQAQNAGLEPVLKTANGEPRKVFGHYMGCFVAGSGAIQWHAREGISVMGFTSKESSPLKRDIAEFAAKSNGGRLRNFGLAPYTRTLKMEEAADVEIRRAMRAGLDGFTFDAWAGGAGAMQLLDAMFTICEAKKYPFELTISLDSTCIPEDMAELKPYTGSRWVRCVKWLLDKHGESPNLARRNGKPMIMGYQSIWPAYYKIIELAKQNLGPTADKDAVDKEAKRLRWTREGIQALGQGYREMDQDIGQPIYWQFCMSAMTHWSKPPNDEAWVVAARTLAEEFPAVGMFMAEGPVDKIAQAVVQAGAEWCHPIKLQYENYSWYQSSSPGTDWIRRDWEKARQIPSSLMQYITWNDYQENTNLSPGYNSRYAYTDLTSYYIKWWKTGQTPKPERDKLYIFSHKYAHNTKMYPFKAATRSDNVIEIVTILTRPGTVRLPGRDAGWEAPAGFSYKQFPLTPGPVQAQLVRGAKTELDVTCQEPVSDKPFRQDIGKTSASSEDSRQWKEDYGDEPEFVYSEYGDADGDGLPNWFEMLWFGKFGDMSTATGALPDADPDGDGRTNLQEFQDQTDPTKPPVAPAPEAPAAP